ncbi:MAG: hypothetical protein V4584_09735 [Verrucomicrobiota bacterium]
MSYDDDWPDMTWENRRAKIKKTIRPATIDELKKLGEMRFPVVTDPWCIRYHEFLNTHPDARFYQAEIPEKAEVVYCREGEKGIWFIPGKGMGIIQSRGLDMLREIVDAL